MCLSGLDGYRNLDNVVLPVVIVHLIVPLCFRSLRIPVLKEAFLIDCVNQKSDISVEQYTVEIAAASSVMKVKVKGRSAVHEDSGLQERGHILEQGNTIYNITLNLSDLNSNKNRSELYLFQFSNFRPFHVVVYAISCSSIFVKFFCQCRLIDGTACCSVTIFCRSLRRMETKQLTCFENGAALGVKEVKSQRNFLKLQRLVSSSVSLLRRREMNGILGRRKTTSKSTLGNIIPSKS